jgi:hypothetical protein
MGIYKDRAEQPDREEMIIAVVLTPEYGGELTLKEMP